MSDCHACHLDGNPGPACIACAKKDVVRWKKTGSPDTQHNKGHTHVSVDEVADFVPAPSATVDDAEACHDATVYFIRSVCGLGVIEREILFSRLNGMQYPAIAKRLRLVLGRSLTTQAIHCRAKRALRDPAFAELFRAMLAKQKKGFGLLTRREKTETIANLFKLPRLLSERARLVADHLDSGNKDEELSGQIRELDRKITIAWKFPHMLMDI